MTRPISHLPLSGLSALLALIFAGCEKPQVRVYTVEKDKPAATPAPTAKATPETPERPRSQITYTLPPGWKETGANSLSVVNFAVTTDAGQATVNIAGVTGSMPLTGIPLPLVSYGGSSLIITLVMLGLLANIATERRPARVFVIEPIAETEGLDDLDDDSIDDWA